MLKEKTLLQTNNPKTLPFSELQEKVEQLPDAEKKPAIIVDLDNTLALVGDRNPYDATECEYDELNHVVYRLVKKYQKAGYKLWIVTGRYIEFWPHTERWLKKHDVGDFMIVMRPPKDKQPDFSLKHRAYNEYIKPHYDVEFVLEDRTRVVKMWREIGLTCFQVKDGDY